MSHSVRVSSEMKLVQMLKDFQSFFVMSHIGHKIWYTFLSSTPLLFPVHHCLINDKCCIVLIISGTSFLSPLKSPTTLPYIFSLLLSYWPKLFSAQVSSEVHNAKKWPKALFVSFSFSLFSPPHTHPLYLCSPPYNPCFRS